MTGGLRRGTMQAAMIKRLSCFLPPLLYMGLIFFLSSRPAPEFLRDWPLYWGMKTLHLVEYAGLAGLWVLALGRGTGLARRHLLPLSALLTFLWGVSDEFHQAFVPGRSARLTDALTDLMAAVAFVGVCAVLRWPRRAPAAVT